MFKQEIFCLHEQVNTIHSNVNMMDSAFHDRICDLNSELRGIKKMQQETDGTSNQSPIQASKMRSDIQITSTPKVSLKPFSEEFQETGNSPLSTIPQVSSRPENIDNSSLETHDGSSERERGNEESPRDNATENVKGVKMKPHHYDGTDDWEEYLTQFEILAEINKWNNLTKALYLAGSLKGPARTVLNELQASERKSFDSLVKALENRFGSVNRAKMYRAKLQSKIKLKDESIPELGQAIRKMTRQAYPNTDSTLRDVLALDHFIDALPDPDMRYRIRESRPKNITDAEILAVRLETYKLADKQKHRSNVRTVEKESNDQEQPVRLSTTKKSTPLRYSGQNHQKGTGKTKDSNQKSNDYRSRDTLSDEMKKLREDIANLTFEFQKTTSLNVKQRNDQDQQNSGNVNWSNSRAGVRSKTIGPKH